jgi:outer membrane lipopolysaccharide assembly protein LptE/RlpB
LLFDQNAVLAVTNESEILYKDMRRDTARLILLKVKARSTRTESTKVEATTTEPVSASKIQSAPVAQ